MGETSQVGETSQTSQVEESESRATGEHEDTELLVTAEVTETDQPHEKEEEKEGGEDKAVVVTVQGSESNPEAASEEEGGRDITANEDNLLEGGSSLKGKGEMEEGGVVISLDSSALSATNAMSNADEAEKTLFSPSTECTSDLRDLLED